METKKLINLTIAAVVAVGIGMAANEAQAAPKKMQQCYGIAKAGKNDCGSKTHSCAGQARTTDDPNEWVLVPKGSCEKMGGNTMPGITAKK